MACRPLCVYCRQRPMESPWAPFCSQRCKDVDLGRWLKGDYRIPDRPELSPEQAPDADGPAGPLTPQDDEG
jgi:endogenous inhibitor of DNA gyrase (YacG/DUF329 family)